MALAAPADKLPLMRDERNLENIGASNEAFTNFGKPRPGRGPSDTR
jgi:hypothetical protein